MKYKGGKISFKDFVVGTHILKMRKISAMTMGLMMEK